MTMLLRAMSPQVVAVDELGGEKDAAAVERVINAGVKLLCTAHGYGPDDVRTNPALARLLKRGIFERYIVLDAPGSVGGIYDREGKVCC
jgi:stage III sporulation protein AA